jgi:hypothetical protein
VKKTVSGIGGKIGGRLRKTYRPGRRRAPRGGQGLKTAAFIPPPPKKLKMYKRKIDRCAQIKTSLTFHSAAQAVFKDLLKNPNAWLIIPEIPSLCKTGRPIAGKMCKTGECAKIRDVFPHCPRL